MPEFILGIIFGLVIGATIMWGAMVGWEKRPFEKPGSVEFYRRIVKMHQRSYYGNLRGGYRSLAQSDLRYMWEAEADLAKAIQRECGGARPEPGSVWPW